MVLRARIEPGAVTAGCKHRRKNRLETGMRKPERGVSTARSEGRRIFSETVSPYCDPWNENLSIEIFRSAKRNNKRSTKKGSNSFQNTGNNGEKEGALSSPHLRLNVCGCSCTPHADGSSTITRRGRQNRCLPSRKGAELAGSLSAGTYLRLRKT
jgi:hypothetical protein